MTKMTIHGGVKLLGANSEIANLELEELSVDPVSPQNGRIWINTVEGRIKFASLKDGVGIVHALPTLSEVTTSAATNVLPEMMVLITAMVNTQTMFAERLAFS